MLMLIKRPPSLKDLGEEDDGETRRNVVFNQRLETQENISTTGKTYAD